MNNNDNMPGVPGKECSHEGCTVIIKDTWEQRSGRGFTYWVDTTVSSQPFVHRHNHEDFNVYKHSGSNGTAKVDSTMSKLVLGELEQAGATDASLAVARRLLTIASTKDSSAAVGALDRLSARLGEAWEKRPGPNEVCKVCVRRPSGDIHLTVSEGIGKDLRRFRDLPLNDGE